LLFLTPAKISILAEKNIIELHAPITKYLSGTYALSRCFDYVTPYRLLTHTSGLPRVPDEFLAIMDDEQNPYAGLTKEHVIAYLECGEFNNHQNKYDARVDEYLYDFIILNTLQPFTSKRFSPFKTVLQKYLAKYFWCFEKINYNFATANNIIHASININHKTSQQL